MIHRLPRHFGRTHPPTQLNRRRNLARLGRPQTLKLFLQTLRRDPGQAPQSLPGLQDLSRQFDRRLTGPARPQQDRQQFRRRQGLRPPGHQTLPGPLLRRQLPDPAHFPAQ